MDLKVIISHFKFLDVLIILRLNQRFKAESTSSAVFLVGQYTMVGPSKSNCPFILTMHVFRSVTMFPTFTAAERYKFGLKNIKYGYMNFTAECKVRRTLYVPLVYFECTYTYMYEKKQTSQYVKANSKVFKIAKIYREPASVYMYMYRILSC